MRGIEHIPWLYDALMTVSDFFGMARWRQWLAGGARGRTLEVGCGTGRNSRFFPSGLPMVALDPDPGLLRAARRRAPAVPRVAARAEALPFADGAFDTVVSSLVFCSVGEPVRGLEEVRRVLAPGGELRMVEHVRSTGRLGARVQDLIQPAWTAVTGGCRPNRPTEAHVEAAGLRIDPARRRARGTMRRLVARAG